MRQRTLTKSLPLLPARYWNTRAMLISLVALSLSLLVLNRTHPNLILQARVTLADATGAMMSIISRPASAVQQVGSWVNEMSNLRGENIALKAEVARLSALQATASELKAENDALRQLIRTVPTGKVEYISARIVSETTSAYMRSALILGGTRDGIGMNQAVLSPDGLVGRVIEAGTTSARVLLLTDINSRVPVVGEMSRERSIISGNNSGTLSLEYASSGKMESGERLLTSGDGGIFPPGIPVGTIELLSNGTVSVTPLADFSRLEFVSVADYAL